MADVKITVLPNGPLLVEGEATLQDAEGKPAPSLVNGSTGEAGQRLQPVNFLVVALLV